MSDRRTTADLAALRREYGDAGLDTPDLAPDPIAMFGRWLTTRSRRDCTSPTRWWSPRSRARARPRRGWCCSRASTSGASSSTPTTARARLEDIEANPAVSLLFPWHDLQRQVRVEGIAARVSAGGERGVLRLPAARLPARRLGLSAVPRGAVRASSTRRTRGAGRGSPSQRRAAAGALGRLPHPARRSSSSGRAGGAGCTTGWSTAALEGTRWSLISQAAQGGRGVRPLGASVPRPQAWSSPLCCLGEAVVASPPPPTASAAKPPCRCRRDCSPRRWSAWGGRAQRSSLVALQVLGKLSV